MAVADALVAGRGRAWGCVRKGGMRASGGVEGEEGATAGVGEPRASGCKAHLTQPPARQRPAGRGLAQRRPDPADRRSVLVALTPQGHQLIEEITGAAVSAAREWEPTKAA